MRHVALNMYKRVLRPILFRLDPESVHNRAILAGRFLAFTRLSRLLRYFFVFKSKKLENEVLGIRFENPIGLAAGFDKNARLTGIMPDIGFGFIEIGSVTAEPCIGNPRPRLHRLVQDSGIIVNYGLANQGAGIIHSRLKGRKSRIPLGISIAKTNDPNIKGDDSVKDYLKSFEILKGLGSYITINISCPNTGDGKSFEDPALLEDLLKQISGKKKTEKILLKISPDLEKSRLDAITRLAGKYKIDGFIVSNSTKKRENLAADPKLEHKGGISGRPVKEKSDSMIRYLFQKTKGKFVIIGCGGVFSGKDAYDKIKNGASLVQLVTGMIYEGPAVIKKINKELVSLLEKDGYSNIRDAIGKGTANED